MIAPEGAVHVPPVDGAGGSLVRRSKGCRRPGSHYFAGPRLAERLRARESGSARSLADTVHRWLPGILPYGGQVTVRQLLNHTSGVPDYRPDRAAAAVRVL